MLNTRRKKFGIQPNKLNLPCNQWVFPFGSGHILHVICMKRKEVAAVIFEKYTNCWGMQNATSIATSKTSISMKRIKTFVNRLIFNLDSIIHNFLCSDIFRIVHSKDKNSRSIWVHLFMREVFLEVSEKVTDHVIALSVYLVHLVAWHVSFLFRWKMES